MRALATQVSSQRVSWRGLAMAFGAGAILGYSPSARQRVRHALASCLRLGR